jgi:hypothetical protein
VLRTGIEFTQYTSKPTIGCGKIKTLTSKKELWRRGFGSQGPRQRQKRPGVFIVIQISAWKNKALLMPGGPFYVNESFR